MDTSISQKAHQLTFKLIDNKLTNADLIDIKLFFDDENEKWIMLSKNIKNEENLTPYSYNYLRNKWLNGKATIVINNENIISFLSLNSFNIKELTHETLDLHIHETATGWTNPQYRKKGINLFARKSLINAYSDERSLFMSFTRGLGASYLLKKLNWNTVSWDNYPFTGSFIGWFSSENNYYKVGYGQIKEMRKLNNHSLNSLEEISTDLLYLWVDNIILLEEIETLLKYNLRSVNKLQTKIMSL